MLNSKEFYSRFSNKFSTYSLSKEKYLNSVNKIICEIDTHPNNLIDLGAGDGKRSLEISNILNIKDITMVDESEEMLSQTKDDNNNIIKVIGDISDPFFSINHTYDIILCLWNVLGHIMSAQKRKDSLINISKMANDQSIIFIDVNNRYNIDQYGLLNVIKNIFKDILFTKRDNGDFNFNPDNDGVETMVHIFHPFELDSLIKSCGLKIIDKKFINYKTGKISKNVFTGQILYKISKI